MRRILPLLVLPLAACSGGEDEATNAEAANAAAAAQAQVPAQNTPVLEVPAAPGNEAEWMGPRESPGPEATAPYANLLDTPVAETPRAR